MNNVTLDGSLNWDAYIRVPASQKQLDKYSLTPGDVLFNATNSPELVGKTTLFDGHTDPVVFSNHFLRLRVSAPELDPWYLARWLTHQQQRGVFEKLCIRWVNQASVRKQDLLSLPLALPPLPEQKRLADILAKADRLRRLRRYARTLSDTYLQSVFLQLFGDPVTNTKGFPQARFSDVCETRLGKMLDAKQQTGEHQRPYLRNVNVQWNRINLSDVLAMDFDEREREVLRLRAGDVLICEGGEVGRAAIWKDQIPEMYYQKALHRARPDPQLAVPEFIVWLMWCLAKLGGLVDYTSQVTIAHLTGIKLKSLEFPLPPLDLQHQFTHIVHRFERLHAQQREAERQAEYLFQTLLHQAFQGEL